MPNHNLGLVNRFRLNSSIFVVCSAQEVKILLPLVRFNLMDTQFFRQDMFDFFPTCIS